MKLYTFFRSSAAFRVRIALNHKGLAWEPVAVHLLKGEHQDAKFGAVNPLRLLPALEDHGQVLSQSLAIIEYLDEAYPGPKLLPAGPPDRAYVRAAAHIVACEIHPLNNLRVQKYLRKNYRLEQGVVNVWVRHWIAEGFAMMESFLLANAKSGRHVHGDQVSMADCCLVPQVFNARRYDCDLSPYPTMMRIFEECMKLEAFDSAQPSRQADAE